MATVEVLTAAKTLELTDAAIVGGTIEADGDIILERQDNTPVNIGNVVETVMSPGGIQMSYSLALGPTDDVPTGTPTNTLIFRTE